MNSLGYCAIKVVFLNSKDPCRSLFFFFNKNIFFPEHCREHSVEDGIFRHSSAKSLPKACAYRQNIYTDGSLKEES